MSTDLHDLLRDAAATADAPDAGEIWRAGRTRARRRWAVAASGVAAAVALVVGVATVLGTAPSSVPPVDSTPETSPSPNTGMSSADPQLAPGQSMLQSRNDNVVFDLLARPGGGPLQMLTPPAIAGRNVMLADGTLVYEGFDPDADTAGDPAVWAMPYDGGPAVQLQPGTDTPGQRTLLGRDDGGTAAVVLLADGTIEAWEPDGSRTEVARVDELPGAVIPSAGSWNGVELVVAQLGSTRVSVHNDASGEDGQVIVAPDGQHEVRDVAHVGEEVVVLLGAVGDGQDQLLRFGPRNRDEPTVVTLPAGPAAGILAVHDGTVAVHRWHDSGGAWASTVLVEPDGSFTVLEAPGPVLLHDADPQPSASETAPSCDPAAATVAATGRTIPVWLPCGIAGVEVERPIGPPADDPATEVRTRLAELFAPLPADAEDAGFLLPWDLDPVAAVGLEGTTAVVDLDEAILDGFPGGATLAASRFHEAIVRTAAAVDGVDAVTFRLDGSCEAWASRNETTGCVTITADELGPPVAPG